MRTIFQWYIYIYIYLIDLKICNPGSLLNYNFYKIIQCSPDCNYLFWAFDSVLRVFIRKTDHLNFRGVVDAVEVCGNVWLVDGFQYVGCHWLLWMVTMDGYYGGWSLLSWDGVGKEVEGGLKVNEDELGDLCERFSCK
jgi:hypothetical protein